ncbi:MAG TPA: hypothetical protein VGE86_10660 [Thermoanaerobaculia bacterium]
MRTLAVSFLLLFVAAAALPHAGEVHTYMGTVSAVGKNSSFAIKTTEGAELNVMTSKTTSYKFVDGKPAAFSDLEAGKRVVVTLAKDAKTATLVKLAR